MVSTTYIEQFDPTFCTIRCRWQCRQQKLVNLFIYFAILLPIEIAGMIFAERNLLLKDKLDTSPMG